MPAPTNAMKIRCCSTECAPRRAGSDSSTREQRRVLRGRAAEVQQQVVERPDVAAAVREVLGEQVVRARVAERGHRGRDHDDERDADRERDQRDGGERRPGTAEPAAHFDAGTAIGRLTPGRWHPPSSRPPRLRLPRRARAAGAPARRGRSRSSTVGRCPRGTRPRRSPTTRRARRPRMFSTESIAVSIEWSWLLYLCMPLRPHGNTFGVFAASHLRIIVDVALVVLVVDRIRLRHPHDVRRPRPWPGRRSSPSWCSSRLPCSTRSASDLVHIASPSFTKYSSPRQVRPSFTMNGDHEPKFCTRPTSTSGSWM